MTAQQIIEKIGFSSEQQKNYVEYKRLFGNEIFSLSKAYMQGEIAFSEAVKKAHLLESENLHKYTINALFVIECMPFLFKKYQEKGIDEDVFINSMKDIKYKLDEVYKIDGFFGVEPINWYERFLDMRRFGLGRLQFNLAEFEFEDTYVCGHKLKKGDFAIACHIPSAGPLKPEMCAESFNMAYEFFKDRVSGGILPVTCHSWLLYPPYKSVFGESSNTGDFIKNFEIIKTEQTDDFDDAWRVFNKNFKGDANDLPSATSMQRKFIDYIKKGGKFGVGYGVILLDGKKILTSE